MPTALKPDPFNAVLFNSPPLVVSVEQQEMVRKVLDKACSDSRFSEKAYTAISYILKGNNIRPPTVTSLVPNTVEIGDPSITLHVHGTNFSSTSKIVFNGFEEPTTFVSATELTTGIDMSVWAAPVVVPVTVNNNGVVADGMNFTFTDGAAGATFGRGVPESLEDKIKRLQKPHVDNKLPEVKESSKAAAVLDHREDEKREKK